MKCVKCKKEKTIDFFKFKKGSTDYYKTCIECLGKVKRKKCNCGSGKRPRFGYDGDKRDICCNDCKKEDMINFSNRNSPKCECGKTPSFGYKDDEYPRCRSLDNHVEINYIDRR